MKKLRVFIILIVLASSLYNIKDVSAHRIYTSKIEKFSIINNAVWTDYDLFTNQGVPNGSIVEIVVSNNNTDFSRFGGVRTDGSILNRYIDLHEAEGGGVTTINMFVKSNVSTGLIEVYSEIGGDIEFYILGWFSSEFDFTEGFSLLPFPAFWGEVDLSGYGVPPNAVAQIALTHRLTGSGGTLGTRATGSGLERKVVIDEAEDVGGSNGISMVVRADAYSKVEGVREGIPIQAVDVYFLGWFGSNINFTEGWTDYSPALDNTWTSKTIAEANASSVISFALMHEDSGAETFVGLREEDSGLMRWIEEHEAEGGDSTGFQASVFMGADKKIEVFCEDASEALFFYTGYFSVIESPCAPVFVNVTGAWIEYNLTSINVNVGTHDAGTLASTLVLDGDTYDISETVGAPGFLISFNWTNVDQNANSMWILLNSFYSGNQKHDIDLQLYNFTSTSWADIALIPDMVGFEWINASIYDLRIPNDFINSTGAVLGRIIHVDAGNINHDILIDFLRLQTFIPYEEECPPVDGAPPVDDYSIIFLAMGLIFCLAIYFLYTGNK